MSKTKNCTDPSHKPHEGLAAGNARLLTALQWAMNNLDPAAKEFYPDDYIRCHLIAWGVKPIVKKEELDDDLP